MKTSRLGNGKMEIPYNYDNQTSIMHNILKKDNPSMLATSKEIILEETTQDKMELETLEFLTHPQRSNGEIPKSCSPSSSSFSSSHLSFTYYVVNFFPNLFSSNFQRKKREELHFKKNN